MDCIVPVSQGSLRGKECVTPKGKKYYSFEGIPYAKPPVGKLRFRDPQPPEAWSGVRDATKPGSKCAQMDPYGTSALSGSEDCLYLNVYTPMLPAEKIQKLPVIFFVHGGRFLVGQGDYYRPDYLIENDVVLVTINYRLHVLGFLCLHTPEVPGNAACKDTIMALRWVQNNIKHFNGDEGNVTAFGESAGAGLVSTYVTSKMADGLVHKVIAQSGVSLSDLYLIEEDPLEKAKQLALNLGKTFEDTKSLYEFLVEVPIEELIFAAVMAEVSRPPYIINAFFLPTIEKDFGAERFFDEYPLVLFKQNNYKKLPMMLGFSSHEGALFLKMNENNKVTFLTDLQRFLPRYAYLPYNSQKSMKIAAELKKLYFGDKDIGDKTKKEYADLASDAYFNLDITTFAEYYSKHCKNTYLYHFSYVGNMNTRIMKKLGLQGATHGDIIQYQFYRHNKAANCSEKDKEVIQFITEAWSNFARNGKPTWSNQQVDWPAYRPGEGLCLNIGQELTAVRSPVWDRVNVWLRNLGERAKL
ncbi:hypothetical protein O0L34_g12118 [Tuta absoluta]|nr:hypothetical protein O0L34_g12118 [Tuta absoluta]